MQNIFKKTQVGCVSEKGLHFLSLDDKGRKYTTFF